ncbi:VPLPA-CTERM sorting domain-containing protein [Rhodovulum steppense]|uniref:Putative secreted protein with PEP-CTERM sorting signal n=1 Tax=Rhodovulum steppense TaxID=540251 RepID=A0A4R1YJ11_9RHOB|nr:VPLPA-CTERM sorting domain-containing protein [Rhodovulum steppense]TCM76571.1 putative secreted protein with PEP-CTERM sorting signal [Rhodovulum steppense]
MQLYFDGIKDHDTNEPMTPDTEYRFPGAPDDEEMGWKGMTQDDWFIVGFSGGLVDRTGDDLVIRLYSGPNSGADVLASSDGENYTKIGVLGPQPGSVPGQPHSHDFRYESFDFADLFADPVYFVKVQRTANGQQTGMFFDAFGSEAPAPVPVPSSILLLAPTLMALGTVRRKRRKHVG